MWFTHTSEPRSPLPREVVHTLGQRLQWTETWTRHLPLVLHYRSTASVCSELIFSKKDLIILWIARLYCILFFFLMSEAFIFSNVNNENISWYFNLVLAFLCFYFLNTLWVSTKQNKKQQCSLISLILWETLESACCARKNKGSGSFWASAFFFWSRALQKHSTGLQPENTKISISILFKFQDS